MAQPELESLRTLRFRVPFSRRTATERAATVVGVFIIPPVALALSYGLLASSGFAFETFSIFPGIVGIATAVSFAGFLIPDQILLSPSRVEERKIRRVAIDPARVDRLMTVRRGKKRVHFLAVGQRLVGFGPGLSPEEFEAARDWMRRLGAILGVAYQEDVSMMDAVRMFQRR